VGVGVGCGCVGCGFGGYGVGSYGFGGYGGGGYGFGGYGGVGGGGGGKGGGGYGFGGYGGIRSHRGRHLDRAGVRMTPAELAHALRHAAQRAGNGCPRARRAA
jgi:hypothetical protein